MKKGLHRSIWIDIILIVGFTIVFLLRANYEFLIYAATLGILIYILAVTNKKFEYSNLALYGFSLWLFLHLLGGGFSIGATRIYDLILINFIGEPYNILRYDQVIHTFCYFVITLLAYSVVLKVSKKDTNKFLIGTIAALLGIAVGAINEMVEFSTVVMFNAEGVGGYYNNSLDLISNFIGAVLAVIVGRKTA